MSGAPPARSAHTSIDLILRGTGELASGQIVRVALGKSLVVGRSRHCGWSLKRSPAYLSAQGAERLALQRTLAYASVSRRHVEIVFEALDRVILRNLSGNGTHLDGEPMGTTGATLVLSDLATTTHAIRLGPEGPVLELGPGSMPVAP